MAVFYSFHYARDAWRVQQITNMGAVEGQPILNAQQWEEVKRQGEKAIQNWIARQMKYKSAVVVLVGARTATRPWVRYEIAKAWNDRRPLLGISIHGLANRNGNTDTPGKNPFALVTLPNGRTVADYVPLFSPSGSHSQAVYANVKANLTTWMKKGYKRA